MRIVQIINSLEIGGAETLARSLHRRYLLRGHDCLLIALAGHRRGWLETGVYCLGLESPYNPQALIQILDLPCDQDPSSADCVHVHLFPSQFYAAVARKVSRFGKAMITTEHSTANRRRNNLLGRKLDGWFYSSFDAVTTVSDAVGRRLSEWVPSVSEKVRVVHNGIDLNRFSPSEASEKPKGVLTIVSVGRLTQAKNYFRVLEAVSNVRKRTELELSYLIAGSGNLAEKLRKYSAELGLNDTVEFLGEIEDVSALLQSADIFLMPSIREGFGLAAAEAMASGLPVVASRLQGISEVVGTDGKCGILIDPESVDEISDALLKLIRDRPLAERLGAKGVRRAERFNISRTVDMYLELYEEMIRNKQG
ncbi:MAG: glycosyltransferase [Candidatus Aegiribacteria sp.]|nr:glycosyltransferase [Candidatus Aegiribacteria sp.]MBD3295576.1 glycosyltransferase [Candidatus Fermentibacteria bacterium]